MTLQSSGAISLQDLQNEFGGVAPISLSEYYRGGGLVPDTPINSAIPTSGTISLQNFYGASAVTLNLASSYLFQRQAASVGGSGAFIGFSLLNQGSILRETTFPNSIVAPSYTPWYAPLTAGIGASYEARITNPSGHHASGWNWVAGNALLDVWYNLSAGKAWHWNTDAFPPGTYNTQVTLQIRAAGGGAVLASSTISAQHIIT
jgi:hypothetical protein